MGAGAKAGQMGDVIDAFLRSRQPPAGKLKLSFHDGGMQGFARGALDQITQINRMISKGPRHIFVAVDGCGMDPDVTHDLFAELVLWIGIAAQKLCQL